MIAKYLVLQFWLFYISSVVLGGYISAVQLQLARLARKTSNFQLAEKSLLVETCKLGAVKAVIEQSEAENTENIMGVLVNNVTAMHGDSKAVSKRAGTDKQ